MRSNQPVNRVKQIVIRADIDDRLEMIAKKFKIAWNSMLERIILEYDKEPPKIEITEPPRPITHPMSDRMWQILDYGRKFNEQRQEQEKVKP